MTGQLSVQPVSGELPADISALRSEATDEGYRFIERLIDGWDTGAVCFDRPGEALLVARQDGTIAGIGGVTVDPFDQSALRMRRFYIRPRFRRRGVATTLATALIEQALKTGRALHVNAGTDAAPSFWENIGFKSVESPHHTHVWPAGGHLDFDGRPR